MSWAQEAVEAAAMKRAWEQVTSHPEHLRIYGLGPPQIRALMRFYEERSYGKRAVDIVSDLSNPQTGDTV